MNNFEKCLKTFEGYLEDRGFKVPLQSSIAEVSMATGLEQPLCSSRLPVIDMDAFAKKGYRKIILPGSQTEDDSINTADAFLIDHKNEWYLIEFKGGKVCGKNSQSAHYNILKKAYSNAYAILDVLYATASSSFGYQDFRYDDPILFLRTNVTYILVFNSSKNPTEEEQWKYHNYINENYLPEYMKRLSGYIYKEAYAMSEIHFPNIFLKQFRYE